MAVIAPNPTRFLDISCLSLATKPPALESFDIALRIASIAPPPVYCAIVSNALNINLGNGTMTVRPDLVISLDIVLNGIKSGSLA